MNLSFGDYVTFAALLASFGGFGWYGVQSDFRSEANRIIGEVHVAAKANEYEFKSLNTKIDTYSEKTRAILASGLEARTNELALAFRDVWGDNGDLVVNLANVPASSKLWTELHSFSRQYRGNSTVYSVGGTSVWTFRLAGKGGDGKNLSVAAHLAAILDGDTKETAPNLLVRFEYDPSSLNRQDKIDYYQKKLREYEDAIAALE
ncbi:hypothetical protein ACSSNL_07085 [Thalassobius sp. S69A]|uniref:hypothetical protein n=1 Tax=unclassified Thalassovita TaxID=2619711 RepID=UPI000C0C5E61|nr:hypothetical protein [Paracoccaceae bacterium]|tara:strand:+ start:242 stop:856 length:615 start_codon:yes stop_codon:yes gene_type:complete